MSRGIYNRSFRVGDYKEYFRNYGKVYREINRKKISEYRKKYYSEHKKKENKYTSLWKKNNIEKVKRNYYKFPEKTKARIAVMYALKVGLLYKLPCIVCGESKSQAHHPDYSKPLEVIWICPKHHYAFHKVEEEKVEEKT